MDLMEEIIAYAEEGFYCSQIMMLLALGEEERTNPDLIRAMTGLNGGMGNSGGICGTLTSGCCVIGYFAGKGEPDELEAPALDQMIGEYVRWFESTVGYPYGGCGCCTILEGDARNQLTRCPGILKMAYEKITEILTKSGVV